jgi:DNA transposition AAA+ family ATPase
MIRFDDQNNPTGAKTLQPLAPLRNKNVDTIKLSPDASSEVLRSTIQAFLETGTLPDGTKPSQSWLAKQIGMTPAVVSAWLSGTYKGDNAKIERLIGDVTKSAHQRIANAHALFETSVTIDVNAACERIRKRNRIALISGNAGIGKTSGIILYLRANPTAVAITAMKGANDEIAMRRALWRAVDIRHFDRRSGESHQSALINHFKNSNRLIVVDNAHRLTRGGLAFLFDFHDNTGEKPGDPGVPICLVGNPEVLDRIRENDQMFSRISLNLEIEIDDTQKIAQDLLSSMCPDHGAELLELAVQVVKEFGHVRALRYQLEEALDLFNAPGARFKTIQQAFKAAHTQLIRDYKLVA